ncbi:restriction endonuclease subunit S [candidate division WWE3 bacterium]|uniref:Restriction endonuclease subunit S n=1 Tax=candidate division WWE3 bacterium TaxID=2053526 RepID=A0A3A4ZJ32_UNCKA|nr:MAG: restriction endonuclease subunit S [candidate division WWE3 bacterium]
MTIKDLPDSWKWVTLDDVKSNGRAVVSGPFGSNIGMRFFVPIGVPVIRGNNLTTNMKKFIDDGFVFVSEEKAQELRGCEAIPGDLIFTAAGSLGQVGVIPTNSNYRKYIISNKQLRARLDSSIIDSSFAFYWFSSPLMVSHIRQQNTGSSVPLINLSILKGLPIPLPPLSDQRAIVSILGALDDKIDLNRQMNQTLEAIAQAVFKSWFVDFDPVKAKAEGREPEGLAPEIAALFPDNFVDSELGPIPEGWRVVSLGEVFKVVMGQSPPGETYNDAEEGLPFFQGIRDFGFRFPTRRVYCTDPTRVAFKGQVLLSVRAPVGALNVAKERCAIGRGLAALGSVEHNGYVLYFLKNKINLWDAFDGGGTVFGSVSKKDINAISLVFPGEILYEQFQSLSDPLDSMIFVLEEESIVLAAIRDTLLPKLISGGIRIKDAEKYVEAKL